MHTRRSHALGLVLIVTSLWVAAPAGAQVGASVSLDSDYRFRGVSLSDGKPVLSMSLSYDHASGAYLGGSAMAEDTAHEGVQMLGYIEYVGFVERDRSGTSWDFGVSNSNFTEYRDQRYRLHYVEIYAGWSSETLSGHIYYSPDYFGSGLNTIYAELNGAVRPAPGWRLFAHVGALSQLSGRGTPQGRRERYDLRAGVAREFKNCELRLTLTTASPEMAQPPNREQGSEAIVAGATVFF